MPILKCPWWVLGKNPGSVHQAPHNWAGVPICMHTKTSNMVSLITLSDLAAKKGQEEPVICLGAYHVTDYVTGNEC